MADQASVISVILVPSRAQSDLWSSPALSIPGAHLRNVVDQDGAPVPTREVTAAGVRIPEASAAARLVASVEIPAGLLTPADIEARKLEFEKDKQVVAERWQRRMFVWTVVSALLTLTATLGGQSLFGAKRVGVGVTVEQLEQCRNSLKRTKTLTEMTNQTVAQLGQAIRLHESACDDLLIRLMGRGDR